MYIHSFYLFYIISLFQFIICHDFSKRRGLEKEVAQLKATIAANPVSREDFVAR
jgi:hypothetical protein